MIDDKIDVDVYPGKKGWNVVVSYWYYDRSKKKRLSSSVTYTWFTDCLEIVEFLRRKQTKVFYSQVKALARQFGKKEKVSYRKGDCIPLCTKCKAIYIFIRQIVLGTTNTLYRLPESEIAGFFFC